MAGCEAGVTLGQPHLSRQDLNTLDVTKLTPLSHEVISRQATINIAGNESCPQPQTFEYLAAIEIMKLKHILIIQNKIDLVKESQAKRTVCTDPCICTRYSSRRSSYYSNFCSAKIRY
uniref:Uncharacterized protein n=1 Tax=Phocoena sinus TaxID=42100 RepID=A0A8C9CDV2_PHOSS